MKKISVIISVYNCEEYIDECLKSLEDQTMTLKEFEVIIINDGSSDESLQKIKRYINIHKDWILISRENKGLSVSRNEGLDIASAKYVTFLDSDDYLLKDALSNMYNEIETNKANIGIFRTKRFNSKEIVDDSYIEKFLSFDRIINLESEKGLASFIRSVAIFYERKLLKEIRFIPSVVHEDNYFCLSAYSKASNIYISKTYVYMIRNREGSNLSITQKLNYKSYKDLYTNIKQTDLEIRNKNIIKIHLNQLFSYVLKYVEESNKANGFKTINEYLKIILQAGIIGYLRYMSLTSYILIKKNIYKIKKKLLRNAQN